MTGQEAYLRAWSQLGERTHDEAPAADGSDDHPTSARLLELIGQNGATVITAEDLEEALREVRLVLPPENGPMARRLIEYLAKRG